MVHNVCITLFDTNSTNKTLGGNFYMVLESTFNNNYEMLLAFIIVLAV